MMYPIRGDNITSKKVKTYEWRRNIVGQLFRLPSKLLDFEVDKL